MGKEVAVVRKRIDLVSRELKPLGQTCQKKVQHYIITTQEHSMYQTKNHVQSQLKVRRIIVV